MKKLRRWIGMLLAFCLLATAMPIWALAESAALPTTGSEMPETPEPAATEAPEPTATETPEPAATEAPEPAATEAPESTATEAPEPAATEAPESTATEAPEPAATEAPEPAATETPEPTATETPEPAATEAPAPTATEVPESTATEVPEPTATEVPELEVTFNPPPTSMSVPKLEEDEAFVVGVPEAQNVPVRQKPDGQSAIVFMLPHRTIVTVLGVEGDWIQIACQGQTGYVYKAHIPSVPVEAPKEEKAQPKVTIFSSREAVMEPGEMVTLTSLLEYADGYEIRYQWECDRGGGFETVEGANDDYYVFEANQETLAYTWRLVVYYR